MKKVFRLIIALLLWGALIPLGAGRAVSALWNSILTGACGFASISLIQGTGLFLLGQLGTAGFVAGVFLLVALIHKAGFNHCHNGHFRGHWHNMTDEQRREFFERRRRWHDMIHGVDSDSQPKPETET